MMYRDETAFFTSADGGATWKKRGQISEGRKHSEADWIRLDNGHLFAAVRTDADLPDNVDAFRSTDDGRTWRFEGVLTLPYQNPGKLTRLPDGRILLSYGIRNNGLRGINVRVGDPEARRWAPPIYLVDLEGATDEPNLPNSKRDNGYPSTVVLADGTLVTAYYSRGMPSHHRYHVGVVRWALPPVTKK